MSKTVTSRNIPIEYVDRVKKNKRILLSEEFELAVKLGMGLRYFNQAPVLDDYIKRKKKYKQVSFKFPVEWTTDEIEAGLFVLTNGAKATINNCNDAYNDCSRTSNATIKNYSLDFFINDKPKKRKKRTSAHSNKVRKPNAINPKPSRQITTKYKVIKIGMSVLQNINIDNRAIIVEKLISYIENNNIKFNNQQKEAVGLLSKKTMFQVCMKPIEMSPVQYQNILILLGFYKLEVLDKKINEYIRSLIRNEK